MFASLVFHLDLLSPLLVIPLHCLAFLMFCFYDCVACFSPKFAFPFACHIPALHGFSNVLFRSFLAPFRVLALFLTPFCVPTLFLAPFYMLALFLAPFYVPALFLHHFACRLAFLAPFCVSNDVFSCMSLALPGFIAVLFYRLHLHIGQ